MGADRAARVRLELGRSFRSSTLRSSFPEVAPRGRLAAEFGTLPAGERVFEPLFTTKARGMGLGLPIAKALAEQNGGAISVERVPGEGSRFVVRFTRP